MSRLPMYATALFLIVAAVFFAGAAEAHRSGCHRWHSCPSDTGSYVCGDLGYSRFCPKGSKRKATRGPKVPGPAKPVPGQLAGKARIIDGDTIDIAGQRIRLHGIDAPETKQTCVADGKHWPCGEYAGFALAEMIGKHWVHCRERDRDRYGRIVAVCNLVGRDGPNVNSWMVLEGWALAYRRYSIDYVLHENTAREARRGIWKGEFIAPWDWRRGKRLAATNTPPGICPIKGNIGRSGERIYHMPGGQFYTHTKTNQ